MKKFLLSASLMFALTLHSPAMSLFFHQKTLPIPAQTNYVVTTFVTNGVQTTATNQVITPGVLPQFEMQPTVSKVLATGETVSGFLPPPYDIVVSGGLTAIGSILAFWLKKKNGQLSTTQTILNSVITGVEAVGDANTKLSIQSHANAAGVQPDLNPIVQTVTANGPGTLPLTPVKG